MKRIIKGTARYVQPFKRDIDLICKMYVEGQNMTEISKEMDLSISAISRYLDRKGIEQRKQTDTKRIFSLEHDYFKEIDDENKAYWLGFIMADGCVSGKNTFSMSISKIDEKHLEKFKNLVSPDRSLKYQISKYSSTPLCFITFRSERFTNNLNKWGIVPRKTFKIDKIPNIPKELIKHFIRGYFDGDGCITQNRHYKHSPNHVSFTFSILGNKPFLEEIQQYLIDNCELTRTNIALCKPKNNQITSQYVKGVNPSIYRILTHLYENSTIYLERKYEKFLSLKDKVENNTLNKLTPDIKIKILEEYNKRLPIKHVEKQKNYIEIGKIFGFKPDTIRHFINKNKKANG